MFINSFLSGDKVFLALTFCALLFSCAQPVTVEPDPAGQTFTGDVAGAGDQCLKSKRMSAGIFSRLRECLSASRSALRLP